MADKYKLLFLLETGERWTVATTTVTLHTGSGYLVMMVMVMMVLVTVVSPSQASQEAEEEEYQPRVLSSNCFSGDLRVLMIFISAKTQS